ncbi:stage III sporulation protein AF [Claveliimonas bilis]|uniref:Stage III sporulation protein AF n=1 Tax=Claveliimonas bilis TaxID=3028070 RepID=A0ABN6Z2U6_9FIRM|nr:stage III sporulation protein AF [Claveliimonas bilis]BDZ77442.1 hypothetical protein Lac1_16250 [Claveliimonas bilis]
MFQYLYDWMQSIAYFMILITILMHVIPNQGYQKYIRFFTGALLVILLLTPVWKLTGMSEDIRKIYEGSDYEEAVERIEEAGADPGDMGQQRTGEVGKAGEEETEIKVEEIQIGR